MSKTAQFPKCDPNLGKHAALAVVAQAKKDPELAEELQRILHAGRGRIGEVTPATEHRRAITAPRGTGNRTMRIIEAHERAANARFSRLLTTLDSATANRVKEIRRDYGRQTALFWLLMNRYGCCAAIV